MNLLAENINTVHYKEKDFIIVAGSEGDSMYILKEGIVSCINTSGEEVRKLNVGSFFGEYSILFGLKRSLDCVAETAVVCFEISKKILLESLGSQFKQLILFSIFKNALEKNAFFNGLVVNSDYDTLFGMFKLTKYASNEIVFPKDDTKMEKKIIVLIEGNLVQGDNSQIVAERGELFGDSILQSSV